ncbi:reverse transcriptase domain-containing protein [Tanacetum coccineum]
MRTRNSYFPNNSPVTIPRRQNRGRAPNIVEPSFVLSLEVAPMVETQNIRGATRAPTEGYGEAIVLPEISADHFEIKTNLLQLVQASPFHGFERDNPHTHINNFKRITSTLKMNTTSRESSSKTDDRIDKLADQISILVEIVTKKVVTPATVKAVEESCVICGGAHAYYDCIATNSNQSSVSAATGTYNQVAPPNRASNQMAPPGSFIQNQASTSGTFLSNTIPNLKGEMKEITTQSGVAYEGPSIPTSPSPKKVVERETEETTDKEQTNFQGTSNQMEKIFQIFQDLRFDISFADALLLMPRFAPTIKNLLMNKEKLFELAKIPLNENCSAMLLKKLPEKLGDPGKFLIPCDFPGMDVCHALADLGPGRFSSACINLMPLSIWKKLSLPELTPTRMTLELADRSITHPKGLAEDVFVKVGKFHFPTDFVVVDFEADPRVPLILGRSFLRTGRALIDVYGEEITLRVNDEAVTFNLDQTTRYSSTYDDMSVNRIDVIDVASEEYAQEVLGFSNNSSGGNPTTTFEPIISDSFLSFTPFEESDFILEEIEAFLKDDSISPEIDHAVCDPEGDICLIEKLLNNDPFQLPPMNLKQVEVTKAKSSIEEPPELELKDLPSHLEYAYLEGTDKLPSYCKSPWVSPMHCVPKKGGITVVANEDNELIPTRLVTGWRVCIDYRKLNEATRKDHFPLPFMDQMLERLAGNEFYCFLDGFSGYFQIPIDPQDQEKTTFTCPYGTFAYRRMPFGLCNAPGTFQRCMMAIFHDMIEKTMEVFMDDFSVFGDSFATCLSNLDNMLKRCEDTNLVLNWEKCHFMCKEGIVLGHKISKSGIEVDRAKVNVIAKLPHPTTVKGVRSFLGHAGFYRRFIQDFSKIARPMTHLLEKETPFVFSKDCIDAFETLKKKLTEAPILVGPDRNYFRTYCVMLRFAIGQFWDNERRSNFSLYIILPYLVLSKSIMYTDHSALKYLLSKQDAKPRLLWWVLLLQEFDITIRDKKGTENLAADHLSRLENPHKDELENKEINENFPLETLGVISSEVTPWFDRL